jgi:alpha-ketoglutarate-dependent taurine dioxygenase
MANNRLRIISVTDDNLKTSRPQSANRVLTSKEEMLLSRRAPTFNRWFQRGLYSSRAQVSIPAEVSASIEDGGSRVVLSHDHEVELVAPWLWSNDPKWIHPTSGQRLKTPADYPGSKIQNVSLIAADDKLMPPPKGSCHSAGGVFSSKQEDHDENLMLQIDWEDSGEPSYYFVNWLFERALPKRSTQVTNQHALRRDQTLIEVDFETLQKDETVRLDLYSAIFQDGAALVRNCPKSFDDDETTPSALIGKSLAGSLSHGSLYGHVFHVQSMSQATNLAYTTMGLPPHQDLAYYESPPGLQLLHCVEQRGMVGGESTLIDGMAAAHALQQLAPDLFDILTATQATFCKQREGADMVAHCPHIQLSQGDIEIVGINWSPPFEGPLRDIERSNDYYRAYAAFALLVNKDAADHHYGLSPQLCQSLKEYAEEHTFEKLLQEGDMLIFNNRRMLHGRKSFEMVRDDGARHLVGTYTNIDDTLNHYRLLMRKFGWRDGMLNAGNGTKT